MLERTCHAAHPDLMECVSNEQLRDRSLIHTAAPGDSAASGSSDYVDGHILAAAGGRLAR
ncbi:MAG: hypothetical protein JWO81_740 [Alphaproteobacteria bacterium]|nr:hypothetical protein [Alphaproteobacteria bacterium]